MHNGAKGATAEEETETRIYGIVRFVTEIEWVCSFTHTASFHELNHKYIIALVNLGKLQTSNNGWNERR